MHAYTYTHAGIHIHMDAYTHACTHIHIYTPHAKMCKRVPLSPLPSLIKLHSNCLFCCVLVFAIFHAIQNSLTCHDLYLSVQILPSHSPRNLLSVTDGKHEITVISHILPIPKSAFCLLSGAIWIILTMNTNWLDVSVTKPSLKGKLHKGMQDSLVTYRVECGGNKDKKENDNLLRNTRWINGMSGVQNFMCWNWSSAVSQTVGSCFRGTRQHALKKLSTASRIQVFPQVCQVGPWWNPLPGVTTVV